MVNIIKDSEYKDMIKKEKKVVIDCYADWCGPCRMLGPILEEVAEKKERIRQILVAVGFIILFLLAFFITTVCIEISEKNILWLPIKFLFLK